jgi:carbonic anhydrase
MMIAFCSFLLFILIDRSTGKRNWQKKRDFIDIFTIFYPVECDYEETHGNYPIFQDDEAHPNFNYIQNDVYGPENWGSINKNCKGNHQSPVHLVKNLAKHIRNGKKLIIDGLNKVPKSITAFNNGHTAGIKFNFTDGPITIRGGPLKVPFILDHVHWHWGNTDWEGSEHVLNGQYFSAEVHFVTYNSNYGEITVEGNKLVLRFFDPEKDWIKKVENFLL